LLVLGWAAAQFFWCQPGSRRAGTKKIVLLPSPTPTGKNLMSLKKSSIMLGGLERPKDGNQFKWDYNPSHPTGTGNPWGRL